MTEMKQELESPHPMVELTLRSYLVEPPREGVGRKSHGCSLYFSLISTEGIRAASVFSVGELPRVIAALREAIQVITDWQELSLPGEISKTIYKRKSYDYPRVIVKAKGDHRWIQWMDSVDPVYFGTPVWVNLSLDQVENLIGQLERIPSLEREMFKVLRTLLKKDPCIDRGPNPDDAPHSATQRALTW